MKVTLLTLLPGLLISLSSLASPKQMTFDKALFSELKAGTVQQVFAKTDPLYNFRTLAKICQPPREA